MENEEEARKIIDKYKELEYNSPRFFTKKKVLLFIESRLDYYNELDFDCKKLLENLTGSNEIDILKYGVTHSEIYNLHKKFISIMSELHEIIQEFRSWR